MSKNDHMEQSHLKIEPEIFTLVLLYIYLGIFLILLWFSHTETYFFHPQYNNNILKTYDIIKVDNYSIATKYEAIVLWFRYKKPDTCQEKL